MGGRGGSSGKAGSGGGGGGQFDAALKSELDKKSLYIKGEPYTYNEVEEYLKTNGVQLAQVGEDAERAEWFNFEIPPHYMQPYDVKIIGESASGKAYKVEFEADTLDGEHSKVFTRYMPKKATVSKSQRMSAWQQETKKFAIGTVRYNTMLDFAKSKNIKGVKNGLKKDTIIKKIEEAGYSYNYETSQWKRKK